MNDPGDHNARLASSAPPAADVSLAIECLMRMQVEGEAALDAMCSAHPDAADSLRSRVSVLRQLGFAVARSPAAAPDALEPGTPRLTWMTLLRQVMTPSSIAPRYRISSEPVDDHDRCTVAAWDHDLDRAVVMRFPETAGQTRAVDLLHQDPRRLARLVDEACVTGQLDHAGVSPVHELGVDGAGRLYFTTRRSEGEALDKLLDSIRQRTSRRSLEFVVSVVRRIAETMAYAHGQGVVHRALRPEHVMVGEHGEVQVSSWGDALAVGRPDRSERAVGVELVAGARDYTAPELAGDGWGRAGPASDICSLGVILAELLACHREQMGEAGPGVPRELCAVRDKATAAAPEARYGSMQAFAVDLRAWLEGRVVRAYEHGAIAELRNWVRRHRAIVAVVGSIVLAAICFLMAIGWVAAADRSALLRLADTKRLADLRHHAHVGLAPSRPETIAQFTTWLDQARELTSRLSLHEQTLRDLRRGGRLDDAATGKTLFDDEETQWHHDSLALLIDGLKDFTSPEPYGERVADVRRRLQIAETVRVASLDAPAEQWAAACRSIGDRGECPRYDALQLTPQLGLVPIGRDPSSGLFEFAHVSSGDIPQRDPATGALQFAASSAIVLVLVPGGSFEMGAQKTDPNAPCYDPALREDYETPLHRVTLAPFFLSKFEMTRGQWQRATGQRPSMGGKPSSGGEDETMPVGCVDWSEAMRVLDQLALTLPTEAQWEYAARAGTTTPWWTGAAWASLARAGNLSDGWNAEGRAIDLPAGVADPYATAAPVGSFRANPFGLHDTIGNVWEWTLDCVGRYSLPVQAGTGERLARKRNAHCVRGGSFYSVPDMARSSTRALASGDNVDDDCGFRPARPIEE